MINVTRKNRKVIVTDKRVKAESFARLISPLISVTELNTIYLAYFPLGDWLVLHNISIPGLNFDICMIPSRDLKTLTLYIL